MSDAGWETTRSTTEGSAVTDIVPTEDIERIVGVQRHPLDHWGRAVSTEQRVYILHSQTCLDTFADLRNCPYSTALDHGIEIDDWIEDEPVRLGLYQHDDGEFRLDALWGADHA